MFAAKFLSVFWTISLLPFSTSNINEDHSHRYEVVILGGGAAGLAAAVALLERGVTDIVILEASDRLGGRIHTYNSSQGWKVDVGAQYIHGQDGNVVWEEVKDLDLTKQEFSEYGDVSGLDGALVSKVAVDTAYLARREVEMTEPSSDFTGSYHQYFISRFKAKMAESNITDSELELMTDVINKGVGVSNGDNLEKIGAVGQYAYRELPGQQFIWWKNGYESYIQVLMGKHPKRIKNIEVEGKVRLEKEVVRVAWGEEGVEVTTKDGSSYLGTRALVTLPLGVLKRLPRQFWQPPLPEHHREAIEALGFGTVNKIFLEFKESWWPSNWHGVTIALNPAMAQQFTNKTNHGNWVSKIMGFYILEEGTPLLQGWIYGDAAVAMEALSSHEVKSACFDLLRSVYPSLNIPELRTILRTSWNSDPFSGGSYSYRSLASDELGISGQSLARPVLSPVSKNPVLLFAGEATHDSHFGTVHGAVETGRREADRILALLNPPQSATNT